MTARIRELFEAVKNNPSDTASVSSLETTMHEQEDWPGLLDLYMFLGEHAGTASAQSLYYRQAAVVAEEKFSDNVRAIELYYKAIEIDDSAAPEILKEMRRLLHQIEAWDDYVEVAQNELECLEEGEESALLLLELGAVLENHLDAVDDAMQCYQLAFEHDSQCLKALWAARRIYRDQGEWSTVSELLQIELELVSDAAQQVEILRELGSLNLQEIGDIETANACYERLLELDPADETALQALGRSVEADDASAPRDDFDTLQVPAHVRPAETMVGIPSPIQDGAYSQEEESVSTAGEQEDVDSADSVEAYGGEIDDRDTLLSEAIGGNEDVAEVNEQDAVVHDTPPDGDSLEVAADVQAEEADGAVEDVAEQQAAESSLATDESVSNAEPGDESDKLVVHEPSDQPIEASHSVEAAGPEPSETEGVESQEDIASDAPMGDEESELKQMELEELAQEAEGEERAELLLQATGFARGDDAARLYLESVRSRPDDISVYWRAGRTLSISTETAQGIVQGLEDLAAEDEANTSVLMAHRLVFGSAHLDEGRTVDFKIRDLLKKGADERVVEWQVQRLLEGDKWRNVQQILTEQNGGDGPDGRISALKEMARLAEERVGRSDKAADFWRQVFQADRSDVEARRALLVAHKNNGKWKEYVDVLKLEVDDIPESDTDAKVAGLRTLVEAMNAHLRQDAQVVEIYQRICELVPDDSAAQDALCEKYEKMRRWPDLISSLRSRAEQSDDQARVAVLLRIGLVYRDKMRNQMEAVSAFEDVLVESPDSVDALEALDGLYEKRRDWENLVSTRIRLADNLEDAERLVSLKALAEYASKKIRRPNITQQLWEHVLEVDPEDLDGRRALMSIYEQTKDWDALVATIEDLLPLTEDDGEKVSLYQKSGAIYQDRMADHERAAQAWRGVLAVDSNNRRAKDSYKKCLIHLAAWDELCTFYLEQDNASELVRILEGQVGVLAGDEAKIDLLFRAADLYLENLEQSDRAVRALERVLQIDSSNQVAAGKLEPIYTEKEDYRKLSGILQTLVTSEVDAERRAELMSRAAQISEEKLRNPMAAFDQLQVIVEETPTSREARSNFIRLGETLDQWNTVHDVLAQALLGIDDPDDQRETRLTLGRILEEEIADYDEALSRFLAVLETVPDDMTAIEAVERLYNRTGRWYDLLGILDRKVELVESKEEQLIIIRRKAVIHEEQLEDSAAAIEAYRSLLERESEDAEALDALQRLFSGGQQGDELRDILERQLKAALAAGSEERVIGIRNELSDVLLNQLGAVSEAVDQLELVVRVNPEHRPALSTLEGLLAEPDVRLRVARILEPIHVADHDWDAVGRILQIRLGETDELAAECALLRRIGFNSIERTGNDEDAFIAFTRLFQNAPSETATLGIVCDLAEKMDRWPDAAELLENTISGLEDSHRISVLLQRVAAIYEHRMDSLGRAVDAHRRALEAIPGHMSTLDALARLYSVGQQWHELLEIYQQKLVHTDTADHRLEIQFKIAQLLEDLLDEPQGAIQVYCDILENDHGQSESLQALARLYEGEEMYSDLAEVYEKQIEAADGDEAITIQLRLGEVREMRLGEGAQALSIYQSVLADAPENEGVRFALERLMQDPDLKADAAASLAPVYTDRDDWSSLIDAYEIQQEMTEDSEQRIELLHKIAHLQLTRAGVSDVAFDTYARAFRVDSSHSDTHDKLNELADANSLWAELAGVYSETVYDISDVEVATSVHVRLGDILAGRLTELVRAREHYEVALQNDEKNSHVVDALEDIYFRIEQWEPLVSLLIRKVENTEVLDEQKAYLFRAAGIFEEMIVDTDRAIDAYRMVAELDPEDSRCLDALERLFLGLERWQDYLDALRQKAEIAPSLEAKKDVYFGIASTFQLQLDDAVGAIETYVQIVEWDPSDIRALRSLDQLYESLEQWEEQKQTLEQQIALVDGDEAILSLRFRLAQLSQMQLGDLEAALTDYNGILQDAPNHQQTLGALEFMIREDSEADMALAILEECLTEQEQWSRLITIWRDYLTVSDDLEARIQIRMKIAEAQDEKLGDAQAAFLAYGEAIREDATHTPAIEGMAALALRLDRWADYVALLEDVIHTIPNELVARDFHLRTARVYEKELKQIDEAIIGYRRVMEVDPDFEDAILALDRLYLQSEAWTELTDILQLRIERVEPEDRVDLLMRLGQVYEMQLDDLSQAIGAYRDVLAIRIGHNEAIEALERIFAAGRHQVEIGELLEPIYIENQDFRKLEPLLNALLSHVEPGDELSAALHRLAQLNLSELDAPERAFDYYLRAVQTYPGDDDARKEVAKLAESTNRWADLAGLYDQLLVSSTDTELNRSMSIEVASIHRDRLNEPARARAVYEAVVSNVDPTDLDALTGLSELYEEDAAWPELVENLARLVDVTYEDQDRIKYLSRAGEILEMHMADVETATRRYCDVLEIEPCHGATLARLARIYEANEAYESLFDIYQRQLENVETDTEKGALCAAMARLASVQLGRPDDAIDLWNQVLNATGEDMESLRALETLYEGQENWREFVDVAERQLAILENDPERELALCTKLGHTLGNVLDRERAAITQYERVLTLDENSLDALWALRELYERTESTASLADNLVRLLALLDEGDEQILALNRQLARVYQDELDRPEQASASWESVLALESHDAEAIDRLEELYTAAEAWRECVGILSRKAENTEDTYDRVSILFRMAEMSAEQLADPLGSRNAYAEILKAQPNNIDAYELLVTAYEDDELWEELVGLLVSRLEFVDDTFEQVELYGRTAEIFEQKLGSPENAFVVLSQAFEATLDDERFGTELARLAGESDTWGPLIETYQNVIEQVGQTVESVPMRLRVAAWWDDKLDNAENAAIHYQHVLAIEPDNMEALSALEVLSERYERWDKAVEVLQRKVELTTDPDERKRAYEKMASHLEMKLDRGDEAIDAYRQAMLLDASDLEVLNALERLYTVRKRWEDLIEILNQQAVIVTDTELVVEKYLQIGELWETRMNAPDRAIDSYRQALSLDDRCLDAMRALEHLYRQQENWVEILDVFELMLSTLTDGDRKVEVYHRLAKLQSEHMRDSEGAVDTYRRVLGIVPGDVQAVEALEVIYGTGERWDDLTEVYELHLNAVSDPVYVRTIRILMAEIFRERLEDRARAIEVLVPVLDVEPDYLPTVATLGELYAEQADWTACIEMLTREVDLLDNVEARVARFLQIGTVYHTNLAELDSAEEWYRKGLDLNRNNTEILRALKALHTERGEWREAVQTLQMMEAASRKLEEKSRCFYEIGQIYEAHLEDPAMAIDYCEQSMDLWPDNVDAARVLVDVYWKDAKYPRLEPLLDLLLSSDAGEDPNRTREFHFRLATTAEQLQKMDKALQNYRRAYELDSTHLPTLQGMGGILIAQEDWDRAFKIFQTVLVHHRETLGPDETASIFHRQGHIKLQVGEKRKALDFFRKALDVVPDHLESLRAVSDLHEARGDWNDVVHYRRRLIDTMEDGVDRTDMILSVGDILGERLDRTKDALKVFNDVLEKDPGNKLVLGKMLGLHEQTGDWHSAVDTLTQLAEIEDNVTRKAKYWCGVATIQQKYLDDRLMAVRSFDHALDADPTLLRAFEAIDQMLTEDKDYERQDRYYRKMLKRAMERQLDDKLVFSLAKNLGEINRSRLKRFDEAAKAYKIALTKKPNDAGITKILAQLYELDDDAGKAISQYQTLIRQDPRNIENYRKLKQFYLEADRLDEAWCVCQVLCFLKKSTKEEQGFFEKYRSRTLKQMTKPLETTHWEKLQHPKKSPLFDLFMMRLAPYAVSAMSNTHKDLGLHKRKDVHNLSEETPFNGVLKYVVRSLRAAQPECYRDPNNRPGLNVLNLNPPALAVGGDLVRGARMQELAFMAAKQLMLIGAQHVVASYDQTYEQRKTRIKATFNTVMKLINPNAGVKAHDELLAHFSQSMQQADANELAKLIQKMSADPKRHLDVTNWLEGLEHTLNRVGLLFANDLSAVGAVLNSEPGTFSKVQTSERLIELILFSLSEEYFALRKGLGFSIDNQH